jgi:putative drug exporter of the RND superfamily
MFSSLARFAARFKYAILLVWLTAAAYLFIYAPALAEVGVTDDSQFLPRDTESTVAQKLLDEKFAQSFQQSPGSATLVIFNPAGLGTDENQEAHSLQGWLVSKNAPAVISGVASPFDNAALQLSLISKDRLRC